MLEAIGYIILGAALGNLLWNYRRLVQWVRDAKSGQQR